MPMEVPAQRVLRIRITTNQRKDVWFLDVDAKLQQKHTYNHERVTYIRKHKTCTRIERSRARSQERPISAHTRTKQSTHERIRAQEKFV